MTANIRIMQTVFWTAVTVMAGTLSNVATADDTEVFFSDPTASTSRPNVLFILDTSTSMYTVEQSSAPSPYDRNTTYSGKCDSNGYYWAAKDAALPDCGTSSAAVLTSAQFDCPAWRGNVDSSGFWTKSPVKVAQQSGKNWNILSQKSALTVCQGDVGATSHSGIDWNDKKLTTAAYTFYDGNYINYRNSATGGGKYRIDVVREVVAKLVKNTEGVNVGLMRYGYEGDRVYRQKTANACEVEPNPDESQQSSNGAPVVFPVTNLDGPRLADLAGKSFPGSTVRDQILYQLGVNKNTLEVESWVVNPSAASQPQQLAYGDGNTCPIPLFTPGGRSPIGGAMNEALLYFAGDKVSQKFGEQSNLGSTFTYPSVPQSRIGGGDTYKSPITDQCAQNFIILLSDGTTEQDNDSTNNFKQENGCDTEPYLTGTPPPSMCVDDLAYYMLNHDFMPNDGSKPEIKQNVITFTVGFKLGTDPLSNSGRQLMRETGQRGGGGFYEAADAQQLEDVLTNIFRQVLTNNTTFSAPAVSVNAFNRTQNLNELYMSLFRPDFRYRWLGNLKKYALDPRTGDILDATGTVAVNPATGFFTSTARSFWTPNNVTDGADITLGGAAGEIDFTTRKIYTDLSGNSNVTLTAAGNALSVLKGSSYAATAPAMLGIGATDLVDPDDSTSGTLTPTAVVDWLYGKDVTDADGDGNTGESRQDMGDPLHSKPVTVIYGGSASSPSLNDAAIFVITNDGVLHSFNPTDGSEFWAYMPESLLPRARDLYYSNYVRTEPEDRVYGLDGNIRVVRTDYNRNGIIENPDSAGNVDKVFIYFGQRRGGTNYYAVDVSNKTSPKLMWTRSYAGDGAGQSWSLPTLAKVRIKTGPTTSEDRAVLFFGGGYDELQDSQGYPSPAESSGRGVYMVDAYDGSLLWRAGPDAGATLTLPNMTSAIPGDVRVLDLSSDGLADRMYVADLGGRIWRFDINNNKPIVGSEGDRLIEGGMLASLGGTDPEDALRFFYAPDAATVAYGGAQFINIAIGSGHRELPATDKTTENWFFGIRDYNPYNLLLTSQYRSSCANVTGACHETLQIDDLVDLTDITDPALAGAAVPVVSSATTARAAGWRIMLEDDGEKVLAESITLPVKDELGGSTTSVVFTSYSPTKPQSITCGTSFGLNRVYVVNALNASPVTDFVASTQNPAGVSRSDELSQGSIATTPSVIFPTPTADPNNPNAPPNPVDPVVLVGLENVGFVPSNPPRRTYWRHKGSN